MKHFTQALLLCGLLGAGAANAQETEINPLEYIHVAPAEGEVSSLSLWSISFDGEWGLENRTAKFVVTAPEGVTVPSLRTYSSGGTYNVYFTDDAELTEPGEYTFTIPAGKFNLGVNGDVLNPEMTFTYTITTGSSTFPEYAAIPLPGTYSSLNDGFTVFFDSEDVSLIDASLIHLFGPDGEITVNAEIPVRMAYISIVPVNESGEPVDLTMAGEYTLVIGARAVSAGGVLNSQDITFAYYITGGEPGAGWDGSFTAEPAAGSALTSIQEVDITFTGASLVKLSDTAGPADFPRLENASGETVTKGMAYAANDVMQVSLNSEVTIPGSYTLVVPKEFFLVDGAAPAEDIRIDYTIVGAASSIEYSITFNPAEGSTISYSGEICLIFEGADLASVDNDRNAWGNNAPHFTSADSNYCPAIQVAKNGFEFSLTHYWEFENNGEYHLVIPAGYFTITANDGSSEASQAIDVVYNVSKDTTGVDNVAVDGSVKEVYNLQGVRMNGEIPAGIYIINGKKTIINK